MRRVIGIGETVFDIVFKEEQPIGAVPGGSVFNSIISLGRCGVPAAFISEAGNDRVGRTIIRFLEENNVDASAVNIYPDSKSPISLAFLNEKNDAEYIFYKDHPHDQLDFDYPQVNRNDVVLFGSFYALNPVIRPQVVGFLEYARQRGAILYYDVNFRASHKNDVLRVQPYLLENFELADIVRGSTEDFMVLFGKSDADQVYRSQIAFYTRKFICTDGSNPVELRADIPSTGTTLRKQYDIPKPEQVVSTIGAGDNFNAGFVYALIRYGITREQIDNGLSETQWDQLIGCAQRFSQNVCQSINNSVDKAFGEAMKEQLNMQ